jgi:hypothetical protein
MQMYNKFRFTAIIAHYITSSPTSAVGDIMFYYNKNREAVFLNQTSTNLLPFVISDPNTIMGPQWQNHSARFDCTGDWLSCDYGMDPTPAQYADGDLFILTKNASTDSPGYVLFDYVIEFKEKSMSPRLLTLPITRILWSQLGLSGNGAATINAAMRFGLGGSVNLSGGASTLPVGIQDGDIFKVVFDRTNSVLGPNSTFITTSLMDSGIPGSVNSLTWQDGTTIYANYSTGAGGFSFYPNVAAAYTAQRPLWWSGGGAITGTTLQFWMSYVGNSNTLNSNPNF